MNHDEGDTMNITVIGATGGTGRHVVNYALSSKYSVTAAARKPESLGSSVIPLAVDFTKPDIPMLVDAFRKTDGVISALGPRSKDEAGIVTTGTRTILEAMKEAGARRLEIISAAPVGTTPSPNQPNPPSRDPGDDWMTAKVMSPIVRKFFGHVYDDLAETEDLVMSSGLDWTIVRPPRLVGGPAKGNFRTDPNQNIRRGRSISRADLAHYLVDIFPEASTFEKIIRIAY